MNIRDLLSNNFFEKSSRSESDDEDNNPQRKKFKLNDDIDHPQPNLTAEKTNTTLLNPATMDKDQSFILGQFLSSNTTPNCQYFERGQKFVFGQLEFVLTHSILARKCKSDENFFHYEVVDHEEILGEGGYGKILGIKGSIKIDEGFAFFEKDQSHVVKVQTHDVKDFPVQSVFEEYQLAPTHLKMKEPIVRIIAMQCNHPIHESFTIMERIEGKTIGDLLDTIKTFNVDQLIELSLNLIDAIQRQIHDYEIVHRDLKVDNVMVCEFIVNVIDYGLSKFLSTGKIDHKFVGTSSYASPEAVFALVSLKERDIYALSIILCLIWGAEFFELLIVRRSEEQCQPKELKSLFSNIKELSSEQRSDIDTLLKGMRDPHPEKRKTLIEGFSVFNKIRVERKLNGCHPDAQDHIKFANDIACHLKNELEQLAKKTMAVEYLRVLEECILSHVDKLEDNETAIEEFLETLNLKEIKAKTKSELKANIKTHIQLYMSHLEKLASMANELSAYKVADDPFLSNQISTLLMKIQIVLQKQEKHHITLDNVIILNKSLSEKVQSLENKFKKLESQLIVQPTSNLDGKNFSARIQLD